MQLLEVYEENLRENSTNSNHICIIYNEKMENIKKMIGQKDEENAWLSTPCGRQEIAARSILEYKLQLKITNS